MIYAEKYKNYIYLGISYYLAEVLGSFRYAFLELTIIHLEGSQNTAMHPKRRLNKIIRIL